MNTMKELIKKSLSNQADDTTTTPISIRLPIVLSNELDELSLTLDKSKGFLISEFIKAGITETNALLVERSLLTDEVTDQMVKEHENDEERSLNGKIFMLNTNYNNDKDSHFEMLKNHEAAAFCKGWKEYICQLSKGDTVYLYQSGVGIVAVGTVSGNLEMSTYDGIANDKYAKALKDFKTGFKAISARQFKEITGGGANFRRTMVEMTSGQANAVAKEIEKLSAAVKHV